MRQAGPSVGKLIATSGDSGLDIDGMRLTTRNGFPSAIGAGILLTSGKWYYEINIEGDGLGQLGWADLEFVGDSSYGRGCGDDKHSWGFDGNRVLWWHSASVRWGKRWYDGDVLGCAVDMDARTISWSLNGSFAAPMGVAFSNFNYTGGFVPAFTLQRFACSVEWGQSKLRYAPPTPDYRTVWQWLVQHKPSLAPRGNLRGTRAAAIGPPPASAMLARGVSTAYTAPAAEALRTVPLRIASGYGKCTVAGMEVSNSVRYSTVTTDRVTLPHGRWYFEVRTSVPRSAQARMAVGWIDRHFRADWTSEDGVGDDEHSWALIIPAGAKRAARKEEQATATRVRYGAVVGCLADLDARTISISVDGRWLGEAPTVAPPAEVAAVTAATGDDDDEAATDAEAATAPAAAAPTPVLFEGFDFDRELAPAVSFMGEHTSATINLGADPFKYPVPPGARGVHFALPNPAPVVYPDPPVSSVAPADGDAAADAGNADGTWPCPVCTFLNEPSQRACGMCGVPRSDG